MRAKRLKTFDAPSRGQWRKWLASHHDSEREVWLVFHKRHTGRPSIGYDEAVNEALCFGWIDSLIKRLDGKRHARKFTPRKPDSKWSTANRSRYARLRAQGLLAPAGLNRAPTPQSYDATRPSSSPVPRYIARGINKRSSAWKFFLGLAPLHRRNYIAWIDSAKQQETKERRLREALRLLEAGQKLGLK